MAGLRPGSLTWELMAGLRPGSLAWELSGNGCSAPLKSDHRNGDLLSDSSLQSLHDDPLLLELARRQVPQRRVNPLPVVYVVEESPELPPGIGEVLVLRQD